MSRQTSNKKVVVVLPAYNAAKTLKRVLEDLSMDWVDNIILVDDASRDNTVELSRSLGLKTCVHEKNAGYGANQKTCYKNALAENADIIVMLHPDHQYDPKSVPEIIGPLARGEADAVFGSRMMIRSNALKGGMPRWKFAANVFLTFVENLILGLDLTEYHSGFRAYSADLLKTVAFEKNSNNFVFDTEIIVQIKLAGRRITEIPILTYYFPEASMIGFWRSVQYGLAILKVMGRYLLHKAKIKKFS